MSQDRALKAEPTGITAGELFERYYDRIVRYIFIRISDWNEAESLGGDVFFKVVQSLDSYKGNRDQIQAWLFKIAHNVVIDYLRKNGRRQNVPIDDVEITDRMNLEELAEKKSQLDRLAQALQQLTPAQREVISLRFFSELTSDEVAGILGKRSGAVREMQRAAIETLRKELAR